MSERRITIDMGDGETCVVTLDELSKEFSWHNMRDSNHCRCVRRAMFDALLELARSAPEMPA